jgi:hypothetical protein
MGIGTNVWEIVPELPKMPKARLGLRLVAYASESATHACKMVQPMIYNRHTFIIHITVIGLGQG